MDEKLVRWDFVITAQPQKSNVNSTITLLLEEGLDRSEAFDEYVKHAQENKIVGRIVSYATIAE